MNELCGQNAGILNVKLVVYIITTRLQTDNNENMSRITAAYLYFYHYLADIKKYLV